VHFFEDAGLVVLLDELLEVLLDDELDFVEEVLVPDEELVSGSVKASTGTDSDEFVVSTCPLEVAGVAVKAKAPAVPPPTRAPVNPTAVIACLSFRRMRNITSFKTSQQLRDLRGRKGRLRLPSLLSLLCPICSGQAPMFGTSPDVRDKPRCSGHKQYERRGFVPPWCQITGSCGRTRTTCGLPRNPVCRQQRSIGGQCKKPP
jgi:hypothetical protein